MPTWSVTGLERIQHASSLAAEGMDHMETTARLPTSVPPMLRYHDAPTTRNRYG